MPKFIFISPTVQVMFESHSDSPTLINRNIYIVQPPPVPTELQSCIATPPMQKKL